MLFLIKQVQPENINNVFLIFNYQVQTCSFFLSLIIMQNICLTCACNGTAHWQLSLAVVSTLSLLNIGVFLLGETDIEACVQGIHGILSTRIQQNALSVFRADSNETDAVPKIIYDITQIIHLRSGLCCWNCHFYYSMILNAFLKYSYSLIICIKGCKSKVVSFILRKEDAFVQNNTVYFISWAFLINSVPVLRRVLALSAKIHIYHL